VQTREAEYHPVRPVVSHQIRKDRKRTTRPSTTSHTIKNDQMSTSTTSLHSLLLLSDSALPLGSFAFSSGLESFLGHHKYSNSTIKVQAFDSFLENSIANVASTALPYVLAGYQNASELESLDNDFDASTPCTVARRASITQGRALLTIWEKALSISTAQDAQSQNAARRINEFAALMKASKPDAFGLNLNAHFPPLFGAVCSALHLSAHDTAYMFLLNHAKAVLSAAVRASVIGPYQSHAMLSSSRLQGWVNASIEREQKRSVSDAAVTAPTMDLWMGRHELLYSRIFNS
jgi:urease accessory protein